MTFVRSVAASLALAIFAAAGATAQDAAKAEPPTVTLIERGAEPRSELRLRPEAGMEGHRKLVVNMTTSQGPMPMKMPEMRLHFTTKVASVDEEGDINYTLTFTSAEAGDEPGVHPMMRQQMSTALAAMKGMKIHSTINNRGEPSKSSLEAPAGATPMMQQQMEGIADMVERFSAPLPVEAVGIGAKWKVESKVSRQGMEVNQTATYTLKSNRDGSIELGVEISQDADPQDIKNPMMPPGATTRLLSYRGQGEGTLKLNMADVIHSESRLELTNESKISMSMAGQTQEIEQRMESAMSLSTAEPPAEEKSEE